MQLLIIQFSMSPVTSPLLGTTISLSTLFSNVLKLFPSLKVKVQMSR